MLFHIDSLFIVFSHVSQCPPPTVPTIWGPLFMLLPRTDSFFPSSFHHPPFFLVLRLEPKVSLTLDKYYITVYNLKPFLTTVNYPVSYISPQGY